MSATTPHGRRTSPKSVALFGTMATNWREALKQTLNAQGYSTIDNTDERWPAAKTAEKILPLLQQDHDMMGRSDVVFWHHDGDTPGNTARIELGFLTHFGRPVVVHVEAGVASREYMKALCLLYPRTFHWAETIDDALRLIGELAPVSPEETLPAPAVTAS